ncbi:MAG: (Fe-S)-binding protein, partial [Thermodesulfovibrionales bacterium]|nr:(Fe-S)-binding protein [Thermodesulfovibrionales bacterium]
MANPKPEELAKIDYTPPKTAWMDTHSEIKPGIFCHSAKAKDLEYVGMPNPRQWSVKDEDWHLPENWQEIFIEGLRERVDKYRSFRLFLDICVRCGACADKCHFFIGGGDPKNMPVLRAELLRSVYRKYCTTSGRSMG